jgi:hypothetical protein
MKRPARWILIAFIALLLPIIPSLPISRAEFAKIEKDPLQKEGSSVTLRIAGSAIRDSSVVTSSIFAQNFDAVTAPALPAGWTSNTSGMGLASWATSTSGPDTAPNDPFGPESAKVGLTNLNSPVIAVPVGGIAQLQFRNRYNLERESA